MLSICSKYLDWQAWVDSVDPGQMLQSTLFDQDLQCVPLFQ